MNSGERCELTERDVTPRERLKQLDAGVRKLRDRGWDARRIAERCKLSEGSVRASLSRIERGVWGWRR